MSGFSFDDVTGGTGDGLSWDTGVWNNIGSGSEYDVARTVDTVPTDALGSMTPISTSGGGGADWTKFWQGTLQGVLGYAIQRDAVKNRVIAPATQVVQGPGGRPIYTSAGMGGNTMLIVLGLAVVAVIALKD